MDTVENVTLRMLTALRAVRLRPRGLDHSTEEYREANVLMDLFQNAHLYAPELRDHQSTDGGDGLEADRPRSSQNPSGRATQSDPSSAGQVAESSHADDDLPALVSDLLTRDTTTSNTAIQSMHALGESAVIPLSRASSTTSSSPSSPRPESVRDGNDAGAVSDSSLPSLRTVSDSSEEPVSYSDSDSDWDDSDEYDLESMSGSGDGIPHANFPHSPVGNQNAVSSLPNRIPAFLDPGSAVPTNMHDTIRLYHEVSNLAVIYTTTYVSLQFDKQQSFPQRSVIPDLQERLSPLAEENQADVAQQMPMVIDNDPKRAETLLAGMETVSEDLVRRYEKLRMRDGEDGDGCAICRDDLLDTCSGAAQVSEIGLLYAALPFHPDPNSVVAFPCPGKHLFHTHCISPWLARKTTCPSCRFDIDPFSLTLRRTREPSGPGLEELLGLPKRIWQPPQVESMSEWLEAEERAQATGIPRQRPRVLMPTYTPVPAFSASPLRSGLSSLAEAGARPTRDPLAEVLGLIDPEWNYDPVAGNFDVAAAYRDIEEMRRPHLRRNVYAEASRAPLEDIVFRDAALATARRRQMPPRPPSAPPVPPSEASRSWIGRPPTDDTFPWAGPMDYETGRVADEMDQLFSERADSSNFLALPAIAEDPAEEHDPSVIHFPMPPLPARNERLMEERSAQIERRLQMTQGVVVDARHRQREEQALFPIAFENVVNDLRLSAELGRAGAHQQQARAGLSSGRGQRVPTPPDTPPPLEHAYAPFARFPVLTASTAPRSQEPNFVRFPVPTLPADARVAEPPNAFDGAEVPPPIQADPNQALHAVAPLAIQEWMRELVGSSFAGSETGTYASPRAEDIPEEEWD
ncbi:hypothetical protein BD414DRAFT_530479 [Trametes punicea]|nr:hypothetical protein BD414DRAFT_530479 [Trametes punicea]